MVQVIVEGDRFVFSVEGWDKLWALRSRLEIPIAHVRGAHADPTIAEGWLHGLKLGGTNLPGVITAGTFYQKGGLVFWDVHHAEKTIVIDLDHEHYQRLVIEVEDPAAAVQTIRGSIDPGSWRDKGS